MRIGVDATCWQNNRGYGRHARALLSALLERDTHNQYVLMLDSLGTTHPLPSSTELRLVHAGKPTTEAASASGHRSGLDMWRMSRALSSSDFDILLFPTVYSYVPVISRARKVVMIHDVIAEKFPQLTLPNWKARWFWKTKVALGRWQADALVTVSEHSRRGIVDYFKIPPERVYVVGEAGDPVFRVLDDPQPTPRMTELGLQSVGRTIIYVGGFSPHKNLEMLIEAFKRIAPNPDFADTRLVLVGEYQKEVFHSYAGTLRQQVERLGLDRRVVFTGYLADSDLVVLLNRATVLALPSLLEGFGLPAVEAAACGCPVVATSASPLPELLGAGGRFLDPYDLDGWVRELSQLLGSKELCDQLSKAGVAAAGRLTWTAAADQMLEVLRKVGAR